MLNYIYFNPAVVDFFYSNKELSKYSYRNFAMSLQYINTNWQSISFAALSTHCARELCEIGLEPEYILLAEADSLILLPDFDSSKKMVVLVAAKLEGVRLIDNLLIAH